MGKLLKDNSMFNTTDGNSLTKEFIPRGKTCIFYIQQIFSMSYFTVYFIDTDMLHSLVLSCCFHNINSEDNLTANTVEISVCKA